MLNMDRLNNMEAKVDANTLNTLLRSSVAGPLADTFSSMEMAEEIIKEETESLDPVEAKRVSTGAFLLLRPSQWLRGKAPEVYRSHARELVRRVIEKADTRPGTKAECFCALMATSELAPLNTGGLALADRLFRELFDKRDIGEPIPEQWAGQVADDLAIARRRLRDDTRE